MEGYKIVRIIPLTDIDEMGRFIKVYRVVFKYPDGVEDWVDIPEEEFSEEEVRRRIEEKVKTYLALKK